ncbi:MAG TPA: LysM peptidoglycan-binding domain-containing protein [Phnomibacter sp.]|nr:LysM peptidoglycan-binding domain-containing protein [Phnomibacter sp.]
MSLLNKYADLIQAANAHNVANFAAREQEGVLYIDGEAPTAEVKDRLWNLYGQLDPDFRAADVVMNITVAEGGGPTFTEYTIVPGDSLSKIGTKFGKNWRDIYELNKEKIGSNPDYIQAGWVIKIPA